MSFDPVTMMVAAAGTQAVGSLIQGESQAQASEFNAAIARQNAQIAQQQGAAAVQAQQRDAARRIGSMVANYGASGVQVDSGSPVDVLADSAAMATLDRLTLQYNYALKAAGFENQAKVDDMNATTSRTSGLFGAASAGMKAYGTYQYYNGTPVPNFGSRVNSYNGSGD